MSMVALAVHATLGRRRVVAVLAVAAAGLSYEQAFLAAPLLAGLVWWRRREEPPRAWLAPALIGAAVVGCGHALAGHHGVGLFSGTWAPVAGSSPLGLVGAGLRAQLNLEDLAPAAANALWVAYAMLFAATIPWLVRREPRDRVARLAPLLAAGAAWFVLGMLGTSIASPGWFPWRSMLPALGLGLLLTGLLGALSPWLAGGLIALRVVALMFAPVVPVGVSGVAPPAASSHSFIRIARLQQMVGSSRRALLRRYPTLPRGAAVRYWALPELTEWGFNHGKAPRVWYGDSTLTWDWLTDLEHHDAVLAVNPDSAQPAVVIEPLALARYAGARTAIAEGDLVSADTLLSAAILAQPRTADAFLDAMVRRQARVARELGDLARADSLNRVRRETFGRHRGLLRHACVAGTRSWRFGSRVAGGGAMPHVGAGPRGRE